MSVEFVGIELELRGADGVERDLKEIDQLLNSLGGRKKVKAGMSDLAREIVKARGELEKFVRLRKKYLDAGGKGDAFTNEIDKAKNKLKDLQQAQREVRTASKDMGRTFREEFNAISSRVGHIGSAMQSLGNSLVRLSSPFTRIMSGMFMGAGYKALNLMTEGLGGSFERYDIMKNYSRVLEKLGLDAEKTFKVFADQDKPMNAIDNLNEAVLGLPTGLDEIMAAQKLYAGATNEMEKSTKLAIAANNTFIASGMGSREQRFMQRYLASLASGADLTTSQWQSIGRIAPLALNAIAEELGVTTQELRQGKIAGQKFLDAFIKVGTVGKIKDAVDETKITWEGLAANIQNATRRMGQGIIKSLDEVFKGYNGRSLLETLLGVDANGTNMGDGIRHWIDGLSESIQNWIKSHPEEITEFFETLKSIDWKGIIQGFGEGALWAIKVFEKFAQWASKKDATKLGNFMVKANLIGKGLLILGGALKGTRHIWGLLGAFILLKRKGGLLGNLFGGLFGKGATALGSAGQSINGATFAGIGKIGLVAAEITGIVGGLTALVSAFAALDMKLLSSASKNFKNMMENLKSGVEVMATIRDIDVDMGAIGGVIDNIGRVWDMFKAIKMTAFRSKNKADAMENLRDTVWNMRRAAYNINQAAGTTVDVGGFKAFIEQINSAMESLKDMDDIEIDVAVKLSPGFATSVNNVIKQIKTSKNNIKKLNAGITLNIPVLVRFNVSTNFSTMLSHIYSLRARLTAASNGNKDGSSASGGRYQATGGLIYRAKGGGVPFRRRGTDTVPAMLTPGEYVHNKRAVSAFGIDFMRKVNNLDVKGALNELMHRAGGMANINRGTTITNNNYNNQKVVINNNGNPSAGFTFKRAGRFVGAF